MGASLYRKGGERAERGKSENRERNIDRVRRRAKRTIRGYCLANTFDHLVTITFKENVLDLEYVMGIAEKWAAAVVRRKPQWAAVCVPERQKRGAWHPHFAVNGFQDIATLRGILYGIVGRDEDGKPRAEVDVQDFMRREKRHKGQRRSVRVGRLDVARYLSKYVGKNVGLLGLNRHNYRTVGKLKAPTVERITVEEATPERVASWMRDVLKASGARVGCEWRSDDGNLLYMASFNWHRAERSPTREGWKPHPLPDAVQEAMEGETA
jgi:hypothetical protein